MFKKLWFWFKMWRKHRIVRRATQYWYDSYTKPKEDWSTEPPDDWDGETRTLAEYHAKGGQWCP
jgi:hypothetical protein